MTPTTRERIEGGLLGLLIGDALGVPYEFKPPSALPPLAEIDLVPPAGFLRSHSSVPAGTWSDDGAQALCLLASLLERGHLDVEDLGRRFVGWYRDGYLAVGGVVFDVGVQTRTALDAIARGAPVLEAARRDERSNGNGSLMRVLPLALWHRGSDAALVEEAELQSRITHAHPRAEICCALYCLWARAELGGAADSWAMAVARLRGLCPLGSPHRDELEQHVRPDAAATGAGSGYVVDCLHSARRVLETATDYAGAVRAAVALGNDTDTTACVTGGIAGLRYGSSSIPARWRDALRGRELLDPLLARLLERSATGT